MSDPQDTKATLTSVAQAAGVSRQTVSNVLNAPERVKPQTLAHVRSVLAQMGYRPNLAARQLRTGQSAMIGMRIHAVADGISGAVLDGFLHACTEEAQRRGYRLVLFAADSDTQEVEQYSELMDTTALDAFILTGTHYGDTRTQWLLDHQTPFVAFGRPWSTDVAPNTAQHSWVDVNGVVGTSAAVEYLAEQGHRQIGFIGWPPGSGTGDDRRAGWYQAMTQLGVPDLDQLTIATTDGVAAGAAAAQQLKARCAPTAFVCASDSLALGALGSLAQPQSAVIGYDDTPVAAAVGLASIAQPVKAVAQTTFDLLIRQITTPGAPPSHHLHDPHLVIRPSATVALPVGI